MRHYRDLQKFEDLMVRAVLTVFVVVMICAGIVALYQEWH